jgi:hypothetical protein
MKLKRTGIKKKIINQNTVGLIEIGKLVNCIILYGSVFLSYCNYFSVLVLLTGMGTGKDAG